MTTNAMLQLCFLVSNGLLLLIACAAAAVDEQACHCEFHHDLVAVVAAACILLV